MGGVDTQDVRQCHRIGVVGFGAGDSMALPIPGD
jgi:hypothetical protein